MKPEAEIISGTHSYVSNCSFFGVSDTNWYAFDITNEHLLTILKYDLLREGINGTAIRGLNLQKSTDEILITRKGKKFAKKQNFS